MQVLPVVDNLLLRAADGIHVAPGQWNRITFEAGERLWRPGESISHALFPVRGVISLQVLAGQKAADIGLVGREGCLEVSSFFGASQTSVLAVALTTGEAIAMQSELFQKYLGNAAFRGALERYLRMLLVMLNQIAVCNRIHVVEKTLISRLLMMQDRTQSESFHVTQDFLSRVLGVRKATISTAAAGLQKKGAISYDQRGRLQIVDRKRLEGQACSCYRIMKQESDQLISSLGGL